MASFGRKKSSVAASTKKARLPSGQRRGFRERKDRGSLKKLLEEEAERERFAEEPGPWIRPKQRTSKFRGGRKNREKKREQIEKIPP